jgi:lipid-A-disaccharide synthase-like uncharacterized protein
MRDIDMLIAGRAWLVVGFLGQGLFTLRFLAQWIASERAHRSTVPLAFWWLSLAGGLVLFVYALHRRDPVFAVGQGCGLTIYVRNLMLIGRQRRSARGAALHTSG